MPRIPRQQNDELETLGAIVLMLIALVLIIGSISMFVYLSL